MLNFLNSILPDGLERAMVMKGARWAGTFLGGAIATWAFAHTQLMAWVDQACAAMSSPEAMTMGISGIAGAAATLFLSLKDAKTVNAKVITAALTESVTAANDKTVRNQVMAASGSPDALAQLKAKLAAGEE